MSNPIKLKFFELSPEAEAISRRLFGKIVKCIVATHHASKDIHTDSAVWAFPEFDTALLERELFVTDVLKCEGDEIQIVTSDFFIINDIPSECIRILSRDGQLLEPTGKTFMSNYHVLMDVIGHDADHKPKSQSFSSQKINGITEITKRDDISAEELEDYKFIVGLVGNQVLKASLEDRMERRMIDPRRRGGKKRLWHK